MRLLLPHAALRQALARLAFISWPHRALSGASSTKRLLCNQISQIITGRTSTKRCRWFFPISSLASSWSLKADFGTTTLTDRTSLWTCDSTWCLTTPRTSITSHTEQFISWTSLWDLRPTTKTRLWILPMVTSRHLVVVEVHRTATCLTVTISSSECSHRRCKNGEYYIYTEN